MTRSPRTPPPAAVLLAVLAAAAVPLRTALAQAPAGEAADSAGAWNAPRARELVRAAVDARRHAWSDSTLRSFRARGRGHVYFLGSMGGGAAAPGEGEERLVRADQVALRIRWGAPGRWHQTLVGRRGERRLPAGIHYHVDHLVAVLQNFGDRIRMGEGTEVRGVVHPISPDGPAVYDYRLADSVGIGVAGRQRTIHRVEVRPSEPGTAGVVGEVHLDAASKAVVRMRITFTPAAYRDPDLERITVDLRSALWEGRWWLPARQSTTIRRRSRWLDLPFSTVIRTRLELSDYEINPEDPVRLAPGRRVTTLPEDRLEAFDDWREGLYAGLPMAGAGGEEDAEEVRERARAIARDRLLAGGARLAPSVPALSELVRARRAEGARIGAGWRFRLDEARTVEASAGHPLAAGGLAWRAAYRGPLAGAVGLELEAFGDRFTDVGPWPGAAGVASTLGFVVRGEDFTDPYSRSGGRLAVTVPAGAGRLRAGVAVESHRRAAAVAEPPGDDPVRPVRPVDEGDLAAATVGWRGSAGEALGGSWSLEVEGEAAADGVGDFGFARLTARVRARSGPALAPWGWRLDGGAGLLGGDPPPQRLLLLGGRGTVPGHAFRAWGGDRAGWLRLEASRDLVGPWISIRAIAAAGWAELAGPGRAAAARFGGARGGALRGTGGVRPSAGIGVGLVDGLLRVDLVRGLEDGRWEWIVAFDRRLWDVL